MSTQAYDTIEYDDALVRKFVYATLLWAVVGMAAGVLVATQLAFWQVNMGEYLTFGRLRPVHTNAVIFAFAGNAIFASVYYSTPRLCKTPMASKLLGNIHFWGWQAIIVSVAITLPLGITQAREYAEAEWPIDIAITIVWVIFAVNFFWTLIKRREKHLYVAIWFYIATIITIAVLHIGNNLAWPVAMWKSYSAAAGVHDALIQWWYGHNAVAFFLTTPFLGLMYYFLPKAAERPVFSYKLSILHFWSLVFIYIWAGPHHLHYTALPEWASTIGMVFSVMLWMPSWGGMINGLFTLRGAWDKLRDEAVLKFFVIGITFYGMATFEGPMLSVKMINSVTHYTDWTIAHVHSGALGWNGFMTFGMVYWLVPRLWQTKLYSEKLANAHFWIGTIGILVYVVSMYTAGLTQGLMWRAFTETGTLQYTFLEAIKAGKLELLYAIRAGGGLLYLTGVIIGCVNIFLTIRTSPKDLRNPVVEVSKPTWKIKAPVARNADGQPIYDSALQPVEEEAGHGIHRLLEGWPMIFTGLVFVAIMIGGMVEIIPLFLVKSNIPVIKTVKPYTPLELQGRDIYIAEGCYNCHSQMIRPMRHEVERYGEYSKPGEFIYDRPFQWGSKRTGPDLARIGGKYPNMWHFRHMHDPRSTSPGSIMPPYPWLLEKDLDLSETKAKIEAYVMVFGAYYSKAVIDDPNDALLQQAVKVVNDTFPAPQGEEEPAKKAEREAQIAKYITMKDGKPVATKRIVALVAYLQRMGTDIKRKPSDDSQVAKVADASGAEK